MCLNLDNVFNCTAYGKLGRFCRYTFYSTNLLAIFTCLAAVAFGSWVIGKKKIFSSLFEPTLYVSVAFVLIVIGLMALLIAFVGCYAASRELRCLMYSFSVTNIVLFLMMGIGGVMGFVFQQQLKQKALDLQMMAALQHFYGQPTHTDVTLAWDRLQEEYRCCGVDDNKDNNFMIWRTSKWHMDYKEEPKKHVPLSCCVKNGNDLYLDEISCQYNDLKQPNKSTIYTKGCYENFYKDLMDVSTTEASLGIAASISLLIPSFFCAILARLIQK